MKELHNKHYSWESIVDIEEDITDALDKTGLTGEFKGTIRVVITYFPSGKKDYED